MTSFPEVEFTTKLVKTHANSCDCKGEDCIFASGLISHPNHKTFYKILLHSGEKTNLNFSIEIDPNELPLVEGNITSTNENVTMDYTNGILSYLKKENNTVKILKLKIDPHLKKPTEARGTIFETSDRHNLNSKDQAIKKLHCLF